jgi:nucleoside-diphosphate-sugar epimerase
VCVTRCGNLFGPGDLNWNRIVPGTIRSVIRGERPIVRSDGSFVRDYVYVGDAVAAYLDLAEQMTRPEIVGEAFNFSDEQPAERPRDRRPHPRRRRPPRPRARRPRPGQPRDPRAVPRVRQGPRRASAGARASASTPASPRTVAWYRELLA